MRVNKGVVVVAHIFKSIYSIYSKSIY